MSVRAGVGESLVVLKKFTTGGYYYMYLLPMRENSRENERENSRENERENERENGRGKGKTVGKTVGEKGKR